MVALSPRTLAQQAEDLKKLFFEPGGSIHEDAQFEYSESPLLDFAGVPPYEILRGFRQPVRSENVSESWCAQALPIREDETRKMIEYAGRVLANPTSRDGTRHEAIFVSFGPGTGKTSFMISAAEALDEFAFIQTRRRPLVITLTYNARMSPSITKTARKDASDGQAAALRMLFGALKSMGCKGVRDWSDVLRDLAPMGMHADLWTHIQDPAWAMEILAIWFGQRPAQILIVDELIKATCEASAYLHETSSVSELARSFYSLMDTIPGLIVMQSAMSTEQIDTTGSNRRAVNLLMKVFTKAEFDAADPRLVFADLDLRSEDRDLVFALGGGHPRTMRRIVGGAAEQRDGSGRNAIFAAAGSEVCEGRCDDAVLELVLENAGERMAAFGNFDELMELNLNGRNGETLSVRNLVHAGTLSTVNVLGIPGILTFDVPGARFLELRFQNPQDRMPPRVRLLAKALDCEVLDAARTRAADVAERISIFATLLGLSSIEPPNTGRENADQGSLPDLLADILPCLNDVLQTEDRSIQSCWAGAGDEEPIKSFLASLRLASLRLGAAALPAVGVDTVGALRELSEDELKQALRSVAKSVPQVQVVNDLAIPNEEGTAEEKLSRLIAFLREPQRQPAAADGRWSARIVASPRGCPSVDYVVHLQATGSIRHDRYIAVQVKSAIGTATTSTEEISERLRRTLDRAARNLAEKDFQFDAFVLHTADDVDIVPDKQAPWFEKLPAWVVSGKAFARHFPPSVLALMSLVAADE